MFQKISFQFSPHQYGLLPGRVPSSSGATRSRSLTPSLSSQFAFPFLNPSASAAATSSSPLGLGLFDPSDPCSPSRLLTLLHHQTLLAEEALRYRGLLFGGAAAAAASANTKEPSHHSPLTEMLMKEQQDHFSKFSPSRFPLFVSPDLSITRTSAASSKFLPEDLRSDKQRNADDQFYKRPRSLLSNDAGHFEAKRMKECRDLLRNATPSPIASSLSSLMTLKQITDAGLLNDHSVDSQQDKEIKCHICMANFPSTWLLEQHTNLQHPTLHQSKSARMHEEKPFKCEECGETSRYNCCKYRSAYTNQTTDQSHRARVPADKLFTCDVCGMQFRYLKSFKKHRLNHALERLHGKKDKHGDNEPVSSTNENEGVDLSGIKDEENISEDEDQDNTIDSVGAHSSDHLRISHDRLSTISSSATENAGCDTDALRNEPEPSSSLTSLTTLINSETIPNQQLLGLNPQEASILNFLRVDAAEKQRDRRFACPFCGKCVRSKENLKLHVRKHTGERPFVCLFCGRAFGGKSDLTRHLRIHTGERPYHCEACGKCFARADYLSKHLTTHVHNGPRG